MTEKPSNPTSKSKSGKRSRPKDTETDHVETASPEAPVMSDNAEPDADGETSEKSASDTKEEGELSKRQKKKLRRLNRQNETHPALTYLDEWNTGSGKFKKVRQTYLLFNCFDEERLPDSYFKLFVKYIKGLQGKSRETTLIEASAILAWNEDHQDIIKQFNKQQEKKRSNKEVDDKSTDQKDEEQTEPIELPPFIFSGKEAPASWKTRIGKKRAKKIVKTLQDSSS